MLHTRAGMRGCPLDTAIDGIYTCIALTVMMTFCLIVSSDADANIESETIIIGVNADLSLAAVDAGRAILHGVELAVDEANAFGGIGGRRIEVIARDHAGVSSRGVENISVFAKQKNLLGVVGGIHSNVILSELADIHRLKIPYLVPWAAAVDIIDNGFEPNYVFRVGARDQHVGEFLIEKAAKKGKKIALILEQTIWGRSNFREMSHALKLRKQLPIRTEWFARGASEYKIQVANIIKSKPDAIIMVLNGPESALALRELVSLKSKIPVYSHWGVVSGGFDQASLQDSRFTFQFIQLFSFLREDSKATRRLLHRYLQKVTDQRVESILAPAGIAFAYDLTRILIEAGQGVWPVRRELIREKIEKTNGTGSVAKLLVPPFTPKRHDALDPACYFLARFAADGHVVPVTE
jgi:ABC-type branched-subunit amino acid transport system substrate-binding protein